MEPTREVTASRRLADAIVEIIDAACARHAPKPPPTPPARPSAPPTPGLLTAGQAARFLAVGQRTLWRLTAPRGPIPVVRLGAAVRYAANDLERSVELFRQR